MIQQKKHAILSKAAVNKAQQVWALSFAGGEKLSHWWAQVVAVESRLKTTSRQLEDVEVRQERLRKHVSCSARWAGC